MSVPGGRPGTAVPVELGIGPGWDPAPMTVAERGIEGISGEINGRRGWDASGGLAMYGGWGWWGPGWGGPWWGFRGPAVVGPSVVVVNNCGRGGDTDGGTGTVRPGAGVVGTGSSPPANAQDGGLWWDNVSGNLFVRYNDGNSAQWVAATSTTGGGGGIAEAPLDGNTYMRKLGTWTSLFDSGRT